MKKNIHLLLIFTCLLIYGNKTEAQTYLNNVMLLAPWQNGDTTIQCFITKDMDSLGAKRTLSFYMNSVSKNNLIYSFETVDNPVGIFPLGEDSANLLVVWTSGSAYHFEVFSFQDGKIIKVLETGSRTYPELIYEGNQPNELSIMFTNLDWIKDKNGESDLKASSAALYRWVDGKYIKIEISPWQKRLFKIK